MTREELIAALQAMPPGAEVLFVLIPYNSISYPLRCFINDICYDDETNEIELLHVENKEQSKREMHSAVNKKRE